jgi:predicted amidophosphoribosyltransferase
MALGYYRGALRTAVRAYKFHGVTRLAALFGRTLGAHVRGRDWRPLLVTHVPLYPARRRRRGFDQAGLLARAVAAELDLPHAALLRRVRPTPQQTRLNALQRRGNVRGAFAANGPAPARLLLVDDVLTTGATQGACRGELERAGAREVLLAVIAVAPPPAGNGSRESRSELRGKRERRW